MHGFVPKDFEGQIRQQAEGRLRDRVPEQTTDTAWIHSGMDLQFLIAGEVRNLVRTGVHVTFVRFREENPE